MGQYKEFTKKFTRVVPYEFICEHCEKNSNTQGAKFTGTATCRKNGWNSKLDETEQADLELKAFEKLDNNFNLVKGKALKEDIYDDTYFSCKCPHCGRMQSWGNNGGTGFIKRDIGRSLFFGVGGGFIIGILIGSAGSYSETTSRTILQSGCIAAIIIFVVSMLYYIFKRVRISNDSKNVAERHLPIVHWDNYIDN